MTISDDFGGEQHGLSFDEEPLPDIPDIQDPVGESPINPTAVTGKKSRLPLFLVIGGVALLLLVVFFVRGKQKDKAKAGAPVDSSSVKATAVAPPAPKNLADAALAAVPEDQRKQALDTSRVAIDATGLKRDTANAKLVNSQAVNDAATKAAQQQPTQQADLFASPPQAPPVGGAQQSSSTAANGKEIQVPGLTTTSQVNATANAGQNASAASAEAPAVEAPAGPTPEEIAAEKAARRQAAFEAMEARKKAERERLRQAGTMIAGGKDNAVTKLTNDALGADAGPVNQVMQAATAAMAGGTSPSLSQVMTGAGSGSAANQMAVTPGISASGVTLNEFVSDQQGAGVISARLTTALRDRGRLILPAGTKAFGSATASDGNSGSARVSINFNTFVLPDGRVLRGVLTAKATDARTGAFSIAAKTNNKFMGKIARAAVGSALDYWITSGEQPTRLSYEAPTPREQAINDIRQRAGGIVSGTVGNEGQLQTSVILPMNTAVTLVFGLGDAQ